MGVWDAVPCGVQGFCTCDPGDAWICVAAGARARPASVKDLLQPNSKSKTTLLDFMVELVRWRFCLCCCVCWCCSSPAACSLLHFLLLLLLLLFAALFTAAFYHLLRPDLSSQHTRKLGIGAQEPSQLDLLSVPSCHKISRDRFPRRLPAHYPESILPIKRTLATETVCTYSV